MCAYWCARQCAMQLLFWSTALFFRCMLVTVIVMFVSVRIYVRARAHRSWHARASAWKSGCRFMRLCTCACMCVHVYSTNLFVYMLRNLCMHACAQVSACLIFGMPLQIAIRTSVVLVVRMKIPKTVSFGFLMLAGMRMLVICINIHINYQFRPRTNNTWKLWENQAVTLSKRGKLMFATVYAIFLCVYFFTSCGGLEYPRTCMYTRRLQSKWLSLSGFLLHVERLTCRGLTCTLTLLLLL
jgi:hypothetical protein